MCWQSVNAIPAPNPAPIDTGHGRPAHTTGYRPQTPCSHSSTTLPRPRPETNTPAAPCVMVARRQTCTARGTPARTAPPVGSNARRAAADGMVRVVCGVIACVSRAHPAKRNCAARCLRLKSTMLNSAPERNPTPRRRQCTARHTRACVNATRQRTGTSRPRGPRTNAARAFACDVETGLPESQTHTDTHTHTRCRNAARGPCSCTPVYVSAVAAQRSHLRP